VRLRDAFEKLGDKVQFFTIYIEEAHPTDGWALPVNEKAGINYAQTTTAEERAEVAEICAVRLDMKMPMLLGDIQNRVDKDYAAHPVRIFVIDENGIVFHRSGMGPRDLDIDGAIAAVEMLADRS
jgi:hypothetical protein